LAEAVGFFAGFHGAGCLFVPLGECLDAELAAELGGGSLGAVDDSGVSGLWLPTGQIAAASASPVKEQYPCAEPPAGEQTDGQWNERNEQDQAEHGKSGIVARASCLLPSALAIAKNAGKRLVG